MRPSDALASILLFSSACAASQAAWDPIGPVHDIARMIRRQDENSDQQTSFDLSFSGVQGNTATTETSAKETNSGDKNNDATSTADNTDATNTAENSDAQKTDKPDETQSGSGRKTTGTAKQTGSKASGESTKTFDARLPAGGISMITPNPMTATYYKINNYVTFAWNYTSLSVTPSAVDVLASCAKNQQTYTIALNQTVQETQRIIWDTGAFQSTATVPLLTETYTLIVHDAAKDISATPQAGYLGVFNQFTFGMYTPQPYTPIADYVCATCNSAISQAEKQTLWALFGMAGLTVLSFGWFTGVAGLW